MPPKDLKEPKDSKDLTPASAPAPPAAPVAPASSSPLSAPHTPLSAPQSPISAPRGPRLAGSISIKATAIPRAELPNLQAEVEPLTQERLDSLWQQAAKECDLEEMMAQGKPTLGEYPGQFRVESLATWFADEFKPHKIDVLECMRRETGMRMLDCKVVPLFVEKGEMIYSPDAKYNAMLERNPQLFELRKLFPMIDY